MSVEMTRKVFLLFLMCVYCGAALVDGFANKDCPNTSTNSSTSPLILNYPLDRPAQSLWFKANDATQPWKNLLIVFGKANDAVTSMVERYYKLELELKKQKSVVIYKFSDVSGPANVLLESRGPLLHWIQKDNWATFSLSSTKIALTFFNENQELEVELRGVQIQNVTAVQITPDVTIAASVDCDDIVTSTSPPPTTTTTTTTPAPTTVTDTTTGAVTTEEDIVTSDASTTPVAEVVEIRTETNSTDPESTPQTIVGYEELGLHACEAFPLSTWIAAGGTILFFVLFVIMVIYSIKLSRMNVELRHSVRRQGDSLRGRIRSPGGYGVTASDMHYYGVRNNTVLAISPSGQVGPVNRNSQTLQARPSPAGVTRRSTQFSTAPRASAYDRGLSGIEQQIPGTEQQQPSYGAQLSPPTINFPAAPRTEPPPVIITPSGDQVSLSEETQPLNDLRSRNPSLDTSLAFEADDERSVDSALV